MANAPLTDILFPEEDALSRLCIAEAATAGAAGGVVTVTLSNSYPPIDRSLACPILGMLLLNTDAVLTADANEGFNITGTMALAPDSAGEFLVTGDRTINIWRVANKAGVILVAYISKGSGNKV